MTDALSLSEIGLRAALRARYIEKLQRDQALDREVLDNAVIRSGMGIAVVGPDGGRVATIEPRNLPAKEVARVADRAAFTAWVQQGYPGNVNTTVVVAEWFEKELLGRLANSEGAAVDPTDGQIVEGVSFVTKAAVESAAMNFARAKGDRASGKDILDDLLAAQIASGQLAIDPDGVIDR